MSNLNATSIKNYFLNLSKYQITILLLIASLSINLVIVIILLFSKLPNTDDKEKGAQEVAEQKNTMQQPYNVTHFPIPDSVNFAGEQVPLQSPDILERFEKEFVMAAYMHTSTILSYKRANRWFPEISSIFKRYNIPDDFKYIAIVESHLTNAISPAQAVGFWQFLEATGREYGLEISPEVDERYDPIKATEAAAKYFTDAYRKFGNWTCVAASYNMGMGGLTKEMNWQKVKNFYEANLNDETSRYVLKTVAYKTIFESPEQFGYQIPKESLYQSLKFKEIKVTAPIPSLVDFAIANGTNYYTLKTYNPWLRSDKLTMLQANKTYILLIPEKNDLPNNQKTMGENTAESKNAIQNKDTAVLFWARQLSFIK